MIDLPPALYAYVTRLSFALAESEQVGLFPTWLVDFSNWRLNLPDRTPCIDVRAAAISGMSAHQVAEHLMDVVLNKKWHNTIKVIFTDFDSTELRRLFAAYRPIWIVIDAAQQEYIVNASSATSATLDVLLEQLPRAGLAPYELSQPVRGNQFFGRQTELNRVLHHPDSNYLFMGIRRVGKTSFLKELERRMNASDMPRQGQKRRLYVDCSVLKSESDFYRHIVYGLAENEIRLLYRQVEGEERQRKMVFDRLADLHGGTITFLIDEVDRLLQYIGDRSSLWDVLRAVSIDRKARFVIAGFRSAIEATVNQFSPFYNFVGAPLRLGALKRDDVYALVTIPMNNLRITLENPQAIVDRIYRETAGLPNLVQYICQTLLTHLDEEHRSHITEDDIELLQEQDFSAYVLDGFLSNTEPLERALFYAMVCAGQPSFTERQIDALLKKRRLTIRYEDLHRACQNLEIAGLLKQDRKLFTFGIPLLGRMLREMHDVDFLFEKEREQLLDNRRMMP